MMMTTGGISGCRRRISSQVSSRTFRIAAGGLGAVAVADPFPVRVPLPGLVYRDDSSSGRRWCARCRAAVVAAAPVRVGEGVVGFGDLPEPLSGVGAVVDVRVVLLGQLAVGLLDLREVASGSDAEERVVVLGLGFHGTALPSGGPCLDVDADHAAVAAIRVRPVDLDHVERSAS